ncbi:hypothetical protein [Crocosphaera sp. Alani8]|uniref:hypothetical protein n=1 Tax=Crocosphaera sp. Alani8 TaxID=3038952 RepID=UPI00313BC397
MSAIARYGKIYFGSLLTSLTLIAGFNWAIDPADIFRAIEGNFNEVKPFVDRQGSSRVKSLELAEENYDTLLVGNSRVFWGLNPEAPAFAGLNAYNGGIKSASLYQVSEILKYADQHQDLKKVILGLNLSLFDVRRPEVLPSQDFPNSGFAGKNVVLANWGSLFSYKTLLHSGFTLLYNRRETTHERYTDRGYLNPDYPGVSRTKNFKKIAIKMQNGNYPSAFNYGRKTLSVFQELLDLCRDRQIELIIFIEPGHVIAEEWLVESRNIKTVESWKKIIVAMVAASQGDVTLWDFSGYNTVTKEKVPQDETQEMQYFLDPIHYTNETGLLIAERIMLGDLSSEAVPEDFGVILTPENISSHIEAIGNQAETYQIQQLTIN